MAWIESHQSLSRHRKTLRAVAALRVDRHKLLGHLHELWWWGLDNLGADGDLGDLTDQEIADGAGWTKDASSFVQALTQADFIDEGERGRSLHDWYEYAGKLLDRRAANAARQRAFRDKHVTPPSAAESPSRNASRNAHAGVTSRKRNGATQQNRTEPTTSANAEAGDGLAVPEALQAFHDAFTGVRGYAPTDAYFAKVAEKYRHLDLEEEAIKIRAWLAGRAKRDCSTAFILTWLKRAAEEAAAAPIAPLPSTNGAARNGASRRNGHAVDPETDEYVEAVFRSRSADDHRAPVGSLTDG